MTLDRIKTQAMPYYQKAKVYAEQYLIRKFFLIGVGGGILLGWRRLQSSTTTVTMGISEYVVTTGNIQNTIDAYGSIQLVDEQKIRFNQQGEVTAVYFKKGDTVKKGDIIAELDQNSVQSNILQSEINLQNAQLQLDETLNGDRSAQILQAQNNLDQSKAKLNIAQQEYQNILDDQNNSGTISDTETIMQNALLDMQNYIIEGEKLIHQLDIIFGVTETYSKNNDAYDLYLSAKKPEYKEAAIIAITLSYKKLSNVKNYYNSLGSEVEKQEIIEGLNLDKELYEAIYNASSNAFSALENSIIDYELSQNDIDSYSSQTSSSTSKSKTTLSNINTTINQITKLGTTEDDKITLETKANEIANLKNTIIIQEKTLETTTNGTTEQQLQIARNNIRQKELALEQTKKDLENLQIVAPFDGTLRKIDFKVGDKVISNDEKYVYLENPNLVEVSISLDQIDVVKVKPGMSVEVELDAYPDETFEGVLGEVDSTPTTANGVVSYTVKVAIDKGEKIMYSGMTASVKIIIENKENVIIVPTTYIQSQGNTKYVIDKDDKEIVIEAGSTNGTQTEIVSGVTQGTTIKKVLKSTTSSSSSSSSFRGMGGGGMGSAMGGGMPPG